MKRACAYWDGLRQMCLMSKAGIYIPLPEHVDTYCTTREFVACRQYQKGCEIFRREAEERGILFNDGRRRYPRVASRVAVALAVREANGEQASWVDEDAYTIDLSIGGMRVETNMMLPVESVVTFTFGADFSSPSYQGLGQVRWARRPDEAERFHAGVSFLEYHTSQAVGEHLGAAL